jgi:DUF1365 family protein
VTGSALYVGVVGHSRTRPVRHALRYRVFMLLIDLDEAQGLSDRLRWFSLGRFNLLSLRPRDYGDGSETPLKAQVEARLLAAGIAGDGGPVRLLTLPRVLGYAFNPISVFYCHARDGRLLATLYEVNSTFGERHGYLIRAVDTVPVVQTAQKRMHVSPFLDMDLRYRFKVAAPGESAQLAIDAEDGEGVILKASFTGRRRPLTDAEILRAFAAHPLVTLKVVAAIHWEAVKLVLKGLRLRGGPKAPAEGVSVGALEAAGGA